MSTATIDQATIARRAAEQIVPQAISVGGFPERQWLLRKQAEIDAQTDAAARIIAAALAQHVAAIEVERDRLRLDDDGFGDRESQAAAWCSVWAALKAAGVLSFIPDPPMQGSRHRAVEFIRSLSAQLADANRRLAEYERTKPESMGAK